MKNTLLSTILNEPLWTLAVDPAAWVVSGIPSWPLLTFTQGKVAIPDDTSTASLIVPVGVLEKPTSVTTIYSLLIFKISDVVTDPIPLNMNCVRPIPTVLLCVNPSNIPNVWEIFVNVTGCWTTPSNPMIVFVNFFVIDNLWAFPDPVPVNVTADPDNTYSGLVNNWKLFSSCTFANTVLGRIVVTIPAIFVVDPIESADAPTPIKVESGV